MSDDVSDITAYYNEDSHDEHGRLDRHQLEYELTWRYLTTYLPPRASILEVGTATGRYTLPLVRLGHKLTAVDMSPDLLEKARQNLAAAGLQDRVRFLVADARDLSVLSGESFTAVLLMGPLYHLIDEADRRTAVAQAYARLRRGGLLFSAFISRFGIMGDLLRERPEWIEDQAEVHSVLQTGARPSAAPRSGFRGYLADPAEIVPLHEAAGFETLVMAGVEPAISADDESYNNLQGEQRRLWLDLLAEISTTPSIFGASRHLLYIGRKN